MIPSSSSAAEAPITPGNGGSDSGNVEGIQVIPVLREKYTISKKVVTQDFTIEKRMIEGIATIKVPVKYEQIYVNGKKFGSEGSPGSNSSLENILSSIKDKIIDKKNEESSVDKEREQGVDKKKATLKGELVSLPDGTTEQILPLFGEEIIIRKRMKQVGDAVITKRKVAENKKVSIKTRGEKVMIRYPDGTERTLESTAPSPSLSSWDNNRNPNSNIDSKRMG